MSTTAQLKTIGIFACTLTGSWQAAHRHNPDLIAVFFAKQGLRPQRARVIRGHDPGFNAAILANEAVHFGLHLLQLCGCYG